MNNEINIQPQGQYKRSFLKIALMFILGFILGWFIAIPAEKYLHGSAVFLPLIFGVAFGIIGGKKKKIPEVVSQDKMSSIETWLVIIAAILNPVLFGAIFYYVWHRRYPEKSKQANKISMIIFLIELIIYVAYKVLRGEL